MLALSIFCSSHRISVALSEGKKLQIYHEKKIKNGKIEGLFNILTKFQKCNALNNLKYILFDSLVIFQKLIFLLSLK